jgi:hypothetical protein
MSLHNAKERKSKRIMRKPLTSKDRENYVHKLREREGRVAWTVNKSRFGQNDILGCIDTISYDPWEIIMDQTSTIHHISDKKKEIQRMLQHSPEVSGIRIVVHGVDGYQIMQGKKWIPVISRHVEETWIDDEWEREEVPIGETQPSKYHGELTSECNITSELKEQPQIVLKLSKDKNEKVVK